MVELFVDHNDFAVDLVRVVFAVAFLVASVRQGHTVAVAAAELFVVALSKSEMKVCGEIITHTQSLKIQVGGGI